MADIQNGDAALAVIDYTRTLFKTLAERLGGDTTLNELRVLNQIIRCHLSGGCCSVTALHKATGIPIATVSRAVANLQSEGWLSERHDPADGRKRIISLGQRYLDSITDECYSTASPNNEAQKQTKPA